MVDPFLKACHEHGLVIDANMLNVFIVGMKNKDYIPNNPSTENYCAEDFDNMYKLFDYCKQIILSTYILPEVSNTLPLDHKAKNDNDDRHSLFLKEALTFLKMAKVKEEHEPYRDIIDKKFFYKFGITDTAIIDLAEKGYAILSNDGPLVGFLINNNFQAKRPSGLQAQRLLASA